MIAELILIGTWTDAGNRTQNQDDQLLVPPPLYREWPCSKVLLTFVPKRGFEPLYRPSKLWPEWGGGRDIARLCRPRHITQEGQPLPIFSWIWVFMSIPIVPVPRMG